MTGSDIQLTAAISAACGCNACKGAAGRSGCSLGSAANLRTGMPIKCKCVANSISKLFQLNNFKNSVTFCQTKNKKNK